MAGAPTAFCLLLLPFAFCLLLPYANGLLPFPRPSGRSQNKAGDLILQGFDRLDPA